MDKQSDPAKEKADVVIVGSFPERRCHSLTVLFISAITILPNILLMIDLLWTVAHIKSILGHVLSGVVGVALGLLYFVLTTNFVFNFIGSICAFVPFLLLTAGDSTEAQKNARALNRFHRINKEIGETPDKPLLYLLALQDPVLARGLYLHHRIEEVDLAVTYWLAVISLLIVYTSLV